jgi:hypothetical protein
MCKHRTRTVHAPVCLEDTRCENRTACHSLEARRWRQKVETRRLYHGKHDRSALQHFAMAWMHLMLILI